MLGSSPFLFQFSYAGVSDALQRWLLTLLESTSFFSPLSGWLSLFRLQHTFLTLENVTAPNPNIIFFVCFFSTWCWWIILSYPHLLAQFSWRSCEVHGGICGCASLSVKWTCPPQCQTLGPFFRNSRLQPGESVHNFEARTGFFWRHIFRTWVSVSSKAGWWHRRLHLVLKVILQDRKCWPGNLQDV